MNIPPWTRALLLIVFLAVVLPLALLLGISPGRVVDYAGAAMSDTPVDPVVTARLALDNYVLTVAAMQPDEWDVTPFVNRVLAAELRQMATEWLDEARNSKINLRHYSAIVVAANKLSKRAVELDPQGRCPMSTPLRLRRHTDGRVAICQNGMWLTTSIPSVTSYPSWRDDDRDCSGDGWSELFVAELPEPDGHIIGDHWALSTISCYVSTDGHTVDIDGIPFSLDQIRSDALKKLAAVAACERYRAEREATP